MKPILAKQTRSTNFVIDHKTKKNGEFVRPR